MKRLLLLVALLATCVVSQANAVNFNNPVWTNRPLRWTAHNTGAKSSPGAYKDLQYVVADDNPWAVDSVAFNKICQSGSTISVTEADTSKLFSTLHWTHPPSALGLGGTSIDSTLMCRFFLSDNGATASSIDSVYFALQVSPDGKNFVYVNQILNVAGINPITATSAEVLFPMLNAAGATTSTPKVFSIGFHSGVETGHYPYRYNWWQYPFARVIVIRKHVTGSAICNLRLSVSYWSAEDQGLETN